MNINPVVYDKRLQVVLSSNQHEFLREIAEKQEVSMSSLIRQVIEQYQYMREVERENQLEANQLDLF